ncbi:MAG: hypothetical protein ACI9VR_004109 [Cognaticolwellia sp.]|jgi:hypothetical protein
MNRSLRALSLGLTLTLGAIGLGLALAPQAQAHPFETNIYSLRTMVKVSESGSLTSLVVLEIPVQDVLKGIGVEDADSIQVKEKKLDAWNTATWGRMAAGLTMTIDGEPAQGTWRHIEHPANGKGGEGFFVYMVGFDLQQVPPASGYTVRIENRSYPEEELVYSGSATAQGDFKILKDSSREILGGEVDTPLSNPGRWTKDGKMRDLEVVVGR